MAYTSKSIRIDGRTIKIAYGTRGHGRLGETQTINVYDQSNREGNYEQVYRIRGPERFVTVQDLIQNAPSLHELDSYLVQQGAVRERL